MWDAIRHEYLWTPTTNYYVGTIFLFIFLRRSYQIQYWQFLPLMFVPITMDYMKREYYVRQIDNGEKDRKELEERRKVVQRIMNEKKKHVTFEQVFRYLFKLNLDRPIHKDKMFLPIVF